MLRAERNSGSKDAELINSYIADGKIVPIHITVNLIKKAMEKAGWEQKTFLIDGFPRSEDNVEGWHDVMADKVDFVGVIFFDADEACMTDRIMERAATSGRVDDNLETLRKRFAQFKAE